MFRTFLISFCFVTLVGCQRRVESESPTFVDEEFTYHVTIMLDLSGSFQQRMAVDGEGYRFAMMVVDRYFRERIGTPDRLVIAAVLGSSRSLLWEGTPQQLRQQFTSADQFRDFLLSRPDIGASAVKEGVARALEYVVEDPQVAAGSAKSVVFILSDMIDNNPDAEGPEKRLQAALAGYARINGTLGLYYVDQDLVGEWRARLRDAGIKNSLVESEIVGRPTLPQFE